MKKWHLYLLVFLALGLSGGFRRIREIMHGVPDPVFAESNDLQKTRHIVTAQDGGTTITTIDPTTASLAALHDGGSSSHPDQDSASRLEQRSFLVKGLKAKQSQVHIAVFDGEAEFPKSDRSQKTLVIPASENQVSFSLQLPTDRPIAIAVFQDLDGSGNLSKNALGIPAEPYGFSNNARGAFGPPSFRQAAFSLDKSAANSRPIEILVR